MDSPTTNSCWWPSKGNEGAMCAIARTGTARARQRSARVKSCGTARNRSSTAHHASRLTVPGYLSRLLLKSHESFWPKRFATPRFL